jgi:hypothetical protein
VKTGHYPRRSDFGGARTLYVASLIDKLSELERKTNPEGGARTAKRKDLAAFRALQTAGKLVNALAGWALDHQAGLALKKLRFLPLQPSGTRTHADYLRASASVDDHQHERNGGSLTAIEPLVARRLLINLLCANPGGFHGGLRRIAVTALEALDYDEIQPFLKSDPNSRKVNLTVLRLQLRAIELVEYRVSRGTKKIVALKEVADALCVSTDTIRSWKPRLQKEFGQLEVARRISFATNSVSTESDAQQRSFKGDETAERGFWEELYGQKALQELAEHYKNSRRH